VSNLPLTAEQETYLFTKLLPNSVAEGWIPGLEATLDDLRAQIAAEKARADDFLTRIANACGCDSLAASCYTKRPDEIVEIARSNRLHELALERDLAAEKARTAEVNMYRHDLSRLLEDSRRDLAKLREALEFVETECKRDHDEGISYDEILRVIGDTARITLARVAAPSPAPDPRDETIARLREALEGIRQAIANCATLASHWDDTEGFGKRLFQHVRSRVDPIVDAVLASVQASREAIAWDDRPDAADKIDPIEGRAPSEGKP
jgi:hypothetical protein